MLEKFKRKSKKSKNKKNGFIDLVLNGKNVETNEVILDRKCKIITRENDENKSKGCLRMIREIEQIERNSPGKLGFKKKIVRPRSHFVRAMLWTWDDSAHGFQSQGGLIHRFLCSFVTCAQ